MEVERIDLFNTGREQFVLSSGNTRVVVVPEVGGRIVELSYKGVNALHVLYPKGITFGPYTEYGGIEEHVGSAPGSLWKVPWKCEVSDDGSRVILSAFSGQTLVRKSLSLDADAPILHIRYEMSNYSGNFARFTFGIHPELAVNGNYRQLRFHVPGEGDVLSGGYSGPGFRRYIAPQQGWCAATAPHLNVPLLFMQMFPEGVIDSVEVYYPKVDSHLVLEPIIFGVGITPQKTAAFSYLVYFGPGDESSIPSIYAEQKHRLTSEYTSADPIPEAEDIPRHEFAKPGGFEIHPPEPPRIPEHAIHDVVQAVREGMREAEAAVRQAMKGLAESLDWGLRTKLGAQETPPEPPRDLRQERMKILQGVAEGRYSVEEAAKLLENLVERG
jgi:hypothetical protein